MTDSLPTRGQLERTLSQQIQAFYRNNLGHRLERVDCQILDQKVVITMEKAITQPEQILATTGKEELAEQVRTDLIEALRPQLMELIEAIVGVSVEDLLTDTTLETERTGIIAVLSDSPKLRNSGTNNAVPQS